MAGNLVHDRFWVDKCVHHDAEKKFHESLAKGGVGLANASQESCPKTTLAEEVAKARQHIKSSLESVSKMEGHSGLGVNPSSSEARLTSVVERLENLFKCLEKRVEALEKKCATCPPGNTCVGQSQTAATKTSIGQSQTVAAKTVVAQSQTKTSKAEDDDVDLFGSDSEEEDEEAKKIKEQRLAEYAAKKSKKPALIAKSNIILDVKPWDDETDMKLMEVEVRKIEMDGLIWGASKLVPLAYGIHKLQISCVVEDDKVSVDQLIEAIEGIEDHVQSVDIAAFNKV